MGLYRFRGMFRSGRGNSYSAGELEKLINRATDETLTSDNWQYILEVCDCISLNPEVATKEAIKQISLRLASRDANIILRTLSLLIAVAENCGSRMKQEIASTSFLNDSMIKRLEEKRLHQTVKQRIAEVMKQLYESFKLDPSLKPMSDAYKKVQSKYSQYLVNSMSAPTKPSKQQINEVDKSKEEDDLQRALKISLQEFEREKHSHTQLPEASVQTNSVEAAPNKVNTQDNSNTNSAPSSSHQKVSKVRAMYDLISYEPEELSFRKGDIITVVESVYRDWWKGSLDGRVGIFPLNYVTPVISKTSEEYLNELKEENQVLAHDSKKVDRLLSLLSADPNSVDEGEITKLYGEVVPLRPLLARFVERNSSRKQELYSLNAQLNAELKNYDDLIEKAITSKTQNRNYGNSPLPYPNDASNFQPSYPIQQQSPIDPWYGQRIVRQPTNPDFGQNPIVQNRSNSTMTQPYATIRTNTNTSLASDEFSNINRFPDVKDL